VELATALTRAPAHVHAAAAATANAKS